MERLLIFGGCFDPIHNGHLRIARQASLLLNADVAFVVSKSPRWKSPSESPEHRLKMAQIAIKQSGSVSFFVDDYELHTMVETNYTIDTIRYFAKKYPDHELFYLIGADQVNRFHEWKDVDKIVKYCHIIYSTRPGYEINMANVTKYNMMPLNFSESGEVSSSKIRDLHCIDLPSKVLSYIEENNLYFIPKVKKYLNDARMEHSLSVAHLAYDIAKANNRVDADKAYIAGLLHDIGKYVKDEEAKKIMDEHYLQYTNMPKFAYHQFVGEYLARKDFKIEDGGILDAIMFHATGKAHMAPLSKIIYSSDKIEPTRGFDSRTLIKYCMSNYYFGFIKVLEANKIYLLSHNNDISNTLTDECMKLYLSEDTILKRMKKGK